MKAVQSARILPPGEPPPSEAVSQDHIFERKIGSCTIQRWLPGWYDKKTSTWFLSSETWETWALDLAEYFKEHSYDYSEPAILEFVKGHLPHED